MRISTHKLIFSQGNRAIPRVRCSGLKTSSPFHESLIPIFLLLSQNAYLALMFWHHTCIRQRHSLTSSLFHLVHSMCVVSEKQSVWVPDVATSTGDFKATCPCLYHYPTLRGAARETPGLIRQQLLPTGQLTAAHTSHWLPVQSMVTVLSRSPHTFSHSPGQGTALLVSAGCCFQYLKLQLCHQTLTHKPHIFLFLKESTPE